MKRIAALLAPLRNRDFTLVWLGQSISQAGGACSEIAIVWLLVGLTGSSTLMGVMLTASYIPTILLLLFGGAIADRYSGRLVAIISDMFNALITAALAVLVTLGSVNLVEIFVFALISGLVGAFFNPALGALYPALTPPEQYDATSSLRQMTTQLATLLGPALAGYIIARWSVGAALWVDAASFAVSFLTLLAARERRAQAAKIAHETLETDAPIQPDQPPKHRESTWRTAFGGFHFLRGEMGVLTLILFFCLTNGLNDVMVVLVPRLVRLNMRLPATAYGLLASCMGAGALLGAFIAGLVAPRLRRRAQVICGAMAVFGLAIVGMGLARNALDLDIAYAVMGFTFATPEVIFGGLLLRIIPDDMRGRVFSVIGLIATCMNPAGLLLAGVLGDTFGPRAGLWIGGGLITLLALSVALLPTVRQLNDRIPLTEEKPTEDRATPAAV